MRTTFETKRITDRYVRVLATTPRGYVWAVTWACDPGSEPTTKAIREAWTTDRRAWLPFDQSAGAYVAK